MASTRPQSPATACSTSSGSVGSTRSGRCGDSVRDGELERERRSLARVGADPDPAAHRADELAADVETEAASPDAAPVVRIEAIELFEAPLLLAERDAKPLVADGEARMTAVGLDAELDPSALRRV